MAITVIFDPPQRTDDPDTFADKADDTMAKFNPWSEQANALQIDVNTKATTATTQAGIATTQAGLAADQVVLAAAQVDLAEAQANNAANSAVQASISAETALSAPGTSATSTTSIAISTGTKELTIQAGKNLVEGMSVKIESNSKWMHGDITSYVSGTGVLIVNVTTIFGSGTYNDWVISLSAPIPEVPGGFQFFSFNSFI